MVGGVRAERTGFRFFPIEVLAARQRYRPQRQLCRTPSEKRVREQRYRRFKIKLSLCPGSASRARTTYFARRAPMAHRAPESAPALAPRRLARPVTPGPAALCDNESGTVAGSAQIHRSMPSAHTSTRDTDRSPDSSGENPKGLMAEHRQRKGVERRRPKTRDGMEYIPTRTTKERCQESGRHRRI